MRGMPAFAYLALAGLLGHSAADATAGTNRSSGWAEDGPLCLQSCQNSLLKVPFADVPAGAQRDERWCASDLNLRSIYLCLWLYCTTDSRDQAYRELHETCLAGFNIHIPPLGKVADYAWEQIDGMERVEKDDIFAPGKKVDDLRIPAAAYFTAWYTTLDAWKYVKYYHTNYGLAMVYFWAVVVAFGAGYRLFNAITYKISPKLHYIQPNGFFGSVTTWLQRQIILPATFGHRCAQSIWWCTIPTRIQTLTLVAFAVINIVFSIHGYRLTSVNLYFPTIEHQIFRYVSDRTGIISFANFPIIWLFGMRNNVAMWLTGWDFGAYNNFHRWVARIATLQAVAHSVGYTVLILRQGGWPYFFSWWVTWWWWAGEIATVAMCLLLACSVYWLRRRRYELFLVLHIAMSAVILGTMLGHVSIFNGAYDLLFWIPVFIWMLDRAVRLLRVLAFQPGSWSATALATYGEAANMIRLRVPVGERVYAVRPGTFYYLSVLDAARSWESHPFTVASVSQADASDSQAEQRPLLETAALAEDQEVDENEGKVAVHPKFMTFLIRPYDGFTQRLRDLAVSKAKTSSPIRVLVDGPYGHTIPLERFSHVVFLVGGSGVVLPLSYLDRLTSQSQDRVSIDIHWSVREAEFAKDVLVNDMAEALSSDNVSISIYGHSGNPEIIRGFSGHIEEHSGRPDIHGVVASKVAEHDIERLAVVACGPASMADDARTAVVDALEYAPFAIEYFEEHFTW